MAAPYWSDDHVTLYFGNCCEVTEWLAADVLVTDPPYGIGWRSGQMSHATVPLIETVKGDQSTTLRDAALVMWARARPAVVFGSWRCARPDRTNQRLIWHKREALPAMTTAAFYSAEEEIYLLGGGWTGKPTQNVIVTHERRDGAVGFVARSGHPTPKPLSLMELLIAKCPPGVIADPFAGSGSTLIAARNQGRKAVGVEIEERYCELAARRLAQADLFAEVTG
jgi:site-specific DNA-methyltransferase (adenine-specific)